MHYFLRMKRKRLKTIKKRKNNSVSVTLKKEQLNSAVSIKEIKNVIPFKLTILLSNELIIAVDMEQELSALANDQSGGINNEKYKELLTPEIFKTVKLAQYNIPTWSNGIMFPIAYLWGIWKKTPKQV